MARKNDELLGGVTGRQRRGRRRVAVRRAPEPYLGDDPHQQSDAGQVAPEETNLRCARCRGFKKEFRVATDNQCVCRPGDDLLD